MTTLARIRTKVRRLTSSPSTNQLSQVDLDNAINDFYILDLPGHIRTTNLRETYTFYTEANVDVYDFPKNTYSSVLPAFYVAGYHSDFYQSREQFFRAYTTRSFDQDLSSGDGTTGPFTGTLTNVPVLRRGPPTGTAFESKVLISAVDSTGLSIVALDTSVTGDIGTLTGTGLASGTVNYLTGAISVTFDSNIPTGNQINSQTVSYVASRPQSCLFYNDEFTIRPVPDKVYKCQLDAYILPTALLQSGDIPEVAQWFEYIAFGAAKKIFEDRQDNDGIAGIMPAFKEHELIALRRTIIQNSAKRTATIFSNNNNNGLSGEGYYGGRW